jgi:replicative DNA helicase
VALDENDLKRAGRFNPDAMSDTVPMVLESSARKSAEAMAKADDPKALPGDVTAETALLSALLWCGSFAPETITVGHVLDLLETPEPFKVAAHRAIFGAMLALYADRRPVDAASVQTEIVKRREDRQTGGADYLERLVSEATPTSEPALRGYAQAIRDAWVRRKIIEAADALARDARSAPGTGTDMLEKAVTSLTELAGKSSTNAATIRFLSCAKKVMRDVISNKAACILTGFPGLDDLITGFFARETTVLAARTSVGKAHPLDTKVLTPTGWRQIGDLATGDYVIGASGKPIRVRGVMDRGELEVFRVVAEDGGSVRCCGDHLWTTRTRSERRRKLAGQTRSTREIASTLRCETKGAHVNHFIQYMGAAEFEPTGSLPIDPYVLGVFLGDGDMGADRSARITNPERDVIETVRSRLAPEDVMVSRDGLHHRIKRAKRSNDKSETAKALTAIGLAGVDCFGKFIPEVYQYASIDDRIQLLRGIMDADGFVAATGRCVELSTSSERMRDDVYRLVGGLGGRCTWTRKEPTFTVNGERRKGATSWRMIISFPSGAVVPVSSEKHLSRLKTGPRRSGERPIVDVVPDGKALCRCICVDSDDGLYVTENFLVTHNSALATHIAFNTTEQDENAAVLYISLEMPSESFVKRMLASRAGVPLKKLRRQCVDERDMQRMIGVVAEFQTSEVHFIESQIQTMMSIHTTAQRLERSLVLSGKRLALIIIDHIGLVRPAAGSEKKSREQQVAEISRGMRALAEKHNCHVMGLAQISRESEKQTGGDTTPRIHHLRESGALEQDPDNVLILHRQRDKGGKFIDGDPGKLFVAKARNDELGMIELDVDMSCMKFTERFS